MNGWVIKATTISEEFTYNDYRTLYGSSAIPMFKVTPAGVLSVPTVDKPIEPIAGDTVIALVNPDELFVGGPVFDQDPEDQPEPTT